MLGLVRVDRRALDGLPWRDVEPPACGGRFVERRVVRQSPAPDRVGDVAESGVQRDAGAQEGRGLMVAMRIMARGGQDGGNARQRCFQPLDQGFERLPLTGGRGVPCIEEDQTLKGEAEDARGRPPGSFCPVWSVRLAGYLSSSTVRHSALLPCRAP